MVDEMQDDQHPGAQRIRVNVAAIATEFGVRAADQPVEVGLGELAAQLQADAARRPRWCGWAVILSVVVAARENG
jgi:hypothetical protein